MRGQLDSVGYVEDGEHWPALVKLVVETLKPSSVLDLGCGPCRSLAEFKALGIPRVVGLDGSVALLDNPHVKMHHENVLLIDLEGSPCRFAKRFDLVWSYEVAEHIADEHNFLVTLTENAAKWIVMTAALPGQGGIGHVNCQPAEHWITAIEDRGFRYRGDLTIVFKALGRSATGYFDGNGMVFERGGPGRAMDDSPAPAPIDISIGAHFCCYKDKRATFEALRSFRAHFPEAPIALVSDNGDDFSDLAARFNCYYTHYTESSGNGRTTEFDSPRQAMFWFRRLEQTCIVQNDVDWVVILEDDVRTQGPIKYLPPAMMAGPCTMPFTDAAKFAIKCRHPYLAINGYSGCGGTIIHRESFLEAMQNFYDIGQAALLDARLARHSDAMLTYLMLWNGFENAPWKDHSERARGVGRADAAFDHQFKEHYGKPWSDDLLVR